MLVELDGLERDVVYHLLTQLVIPRPIAWVLSDNGDTTEVAGATDAATGAGVDPRSRWNLAPYSYFNAVSSKPAMTMFSVGPAAATAVKDTFTNIVERDHHTIMLPHAGLITAVQRTADVLPPGRSEVVHAGLELVDWGWSTPRVEGARIALGCTLDRTIIIDDADPTTQRIVMSRIHRVWVDDAAVGEDVKGRVRVDPALLDPLARLGAGQYAPLAPAVAQPG